MKFKKEKLRDKTRTEIKNSSGTKFSALVSTNYQGWSLNKNKNTQGKNLNNNARLHSR